MSFASKVLYTGDGATASFNIPMPYISSSHIFVFVDEILQLNPMNYTLSGASTVLFGSAPGVGAAIVVRRNTSPTATLVDFVNGSVLNETDLDTAYLHNYYLTQEYADSFNEVINNVLVDVATGAGIVETETDAIIAALVNEMLEDANAANLQARITDIDDNAEAIITLGEALQIQINTLATGIAATVWIQPGEPVPGVGGVPDPIPEGSRWYDSDDNNHPYVYQSSAWFSIDDPRIGNNAAAITVLGTETDDNAAAIVSEQTARTNADSAIATDLGLIGAVNGGGTAFIIDLDTAYVGVSESFATRLSTLSTADSNNSASISTIQSVTIPGVQSDLADFESDVQAEYGVDLSVNGYVSGFRLINGGTPGESAFVILADKFAIVDPSGDPAETEYVPMQIVGGKVRFNANVEIDGDLVVSGTINGADALSTTEAHRIGSTQIGADAITTTHIGADQITANEINAGEISATHIVGTQLDVLATSTGSLYVDEWITMNAAGHMKGGQTAYDTGSGFWIGYDSTDYKFSIGDGATNSLTWDGTTLSIHGDLFVGVYEASDRLMLSADTARNHNDKSVWTTYKEFTIDRPGIVRVKLDGKRENNGTVYTYPQYRIMVDDVEEATAAVTPISYALYDDDVPVSVNSVIKVQLLAGRNYDGPPTDEISIDIRNCRVYADVDIIPTGGTVDTD